MKKISLFLVIAMLLNMANVFAQGGTIGPLTWKLENNTLTISGEGEMPNFLSYDFTPWWNFNGFGAVIIENGVTSIGDNAFFACLMLKTVTLGSNITKMGKAPFDHCIGITSITNLNPVPYYINPLTFRELDAGTVTLYVPNNSVSAYKKTEVWKEFNVVGIEVGIEDETGGGEQLLIYPNPNTGTCTITIPEEFLYENNLTLSIYDNLGKLVQQIATEKGVEELNMPLNLQAKGVYVAILSNGKKSYSGKIVFE